MPCSRPWFSRLAYAVAIFGWALSGAASADVFNLPSGQTSLALVPIGNVGNPNDSTGYGGVSYNYNISKFETTVGQYTQFLNAVAATDTYERMILAWKRIAMSPVYREVVFPVATHTA